MRAIDVKEKICKICKEKKSTNDFYKGKQRDLKNNEKTWSYFDVICKICRLEYGYKRRKEIKKRAVQYLGGKCEKCGFCDLNRTEVFDFHHTDSTLKDFNISKSGGLSFKKMQPELDKCILLCANCHRTEHQILEFSKVVTIEVGIE